MSIILLSLLVASVLISAAMILRDPGYAPAWPMDQNFIQSADVSLRNTAGRWSFHYPTLQYSGGITSNLIVGLYKIVIPTTKDTLNWHIRILAMVLYLGSAWWLAKCMIRPLSGQILAYLLVCVSGTQFIQPTSDVFGGVFLSLALIGLRCGWPAWLAAMMLAIFSLCKIEMLLAGLAISICWGFYQFRVGKPRPWVLPIFTGLWMLLFLFPGFVLQGASPLGANRSLQAFMTSYIDFFALHQLTGQVHIANSAEAAPAVLKALFPEANNFFDIVIKYPRSYFDFLGVSISRSLPLIVQAIKLMLLPLALVICYNSRLSSLRPYVLIVLIAIVATILPAQIIAFTRIRYFTKMLPAIMVISTAGCLELGERNKRMVLILWICGLASVAWEALCFQDMWIYSHYK